jgi:ABC-type polysaccharide/polyol phosphate export permease
MTYSAFTYDSSLEKSNFLNLLTAVFKRRDLLILLVRRDLHVRYRRSLLGLLWSLLNPLISSLVLWFVFVNIFNARLPGGTSFAPYVLAGVLVLNFFSQGFMQAAESISSGVGILQKVYVRPEIFAISSAISSGANFIFGLVALAIVNFAAGNYFSFLAPLSILVILSLILFVTGMGLITSILFIRFDDSRNIVAIFLQLLNYMTPVFYPKEILGDRVRVIVSLNPLSSYLDVFRYVFTNTGVATTFDWLYMFGSSAASLILGVIIFNKFWPKTVGMK